MPLNASGQISLETLLLWGGLAAVFALFLPAFLALLEAHEHVLHAQTLSQRASALESTLAQLAFAPPQTQFEFFIPLYAQTEFDSESNTLIFSLDAPTSKSWSAHAPIPLFVHTLSPGARIFTRTVDGIRVD